VKPDFSGVWRLDRGASDFGFLPPPRRRVDTIRHQDPAIRIVTQQADANGKATVERALTIGGPPVAVMIHGRERLVGARWDGDALVIETQAEVSGRARRIEDCWKLAPDGLSLTIGRLHDLPGGAVRQALLLRRVLH
jgi:hypothetical protein